MYEDIINERALEKYNNLLALLRSSKMQESIESFSSTNNNKVFEYFQKYRRPIVESIFSH